MTAIAEDEPLDLLPDIVAYRTENPPGNERALADYFVDRLKESVVEFDVERQTVSTDRPNVVARAGDPTNGSLLLTGHMDVVPASPERWSGDPFELTQVDERLVGRGTADMKGALAAKLVAAESFLTEHDDSGEVILAFTVDEEVGGSGTQALIESGIEADGAVVGEPTQLQVAIAEFGAVGYTLTVSGESGHSGRPNLAVNAIDGLRRVLDSVDVLGKEVDRETHELLDSGPTINITEIVGGVAPNVIPDEATATLDWRILPTNRDLTHFDDRLADAIEGARLGDSPIETDIEREFYSAGFEISRDAEIVQTTVSAAREIGVDAAPTGLNAVSDARLLAQAGIPTVLCGPGSIEDDAHTVDESITIGSLLDAAEIYRGTLERLL